MHSGVARDLRLKEVNIVGKYTMSSNVRKNFNLAYRLPQDKKKTISHPTAFSIRRCFQNLMV